MVLANKMKNMKKKLRKINEQRGSFNFTVNIGVGANLEQQHYDPRETASSVTTHILGRDGEKKEITDILSVSLSKDETMVLPIYGLGGMGKSTLAQLV
jgi:ABC-type polysaccharide/polyol phosphate transport system ATPase subunit